MARANLGLAAVGLAGAFGLTSAASADIWNHVGNGNTSFATSQQMTGNVTGVRVNVSGDNLFAFTALSTNQFITITSGESEQPGVLFMFSSNGNPILNGSGYQDLVLSGINMTVDIGAQNVGQQVIFAFSNYGVMAQNGSNALYDIFSSGQSNPVLMAPWNNTSGENNSGSETRTYEISGITGVPAPGSMALLAVAGLVAHRRRR